MWRQVVVPAGNGELVLPFEASAEGPWELRARVARRHGGPAEASTRLWSLAGEALPWHIRHRELTLQPECLAIRPGAPLRILVCSPVPQADMLVTVAAGGLRAHHVVPIGAATSVVTFDVPETWVPGVRLKATVAGPVAARETKLDLAVSAAARRLEVDLAVQSEVSPPGNEGRLVVTIADAARRPVHAQVCLSIADETMHELAPSVAAPLLDTFCRQPPDIRIRVSTPFMHNDWWQSHGPNLVHWERFVRRGRPTGCHISRLAPPDPLEELIGDEDDGVHQIAVHPFFPDPLVWQATLQTGPEGVVTVPFAYPNHLTT